MENPQRHQGPLGVNIERKPVESLEEHQAGDLQEGNFQDGHSVDIEKVEELFAAPNDVPDDHAYPTGMKLALILFGTAIAIFLVALVSGGHLPTHLQSLG